MGSRFLALALDLAIQLCIVVAIFWGLAEIGAHSRAQVSASTPHDAVESIAVAIVATIVFLGYFIAFEAFWNGQTPGKRALGIRVVRDGGYPIDLTSAFVRNLIRIGEVAAAFYALSAAAALLSPENKRLGDMAAGTLVVRDSRAQSIGAILEEVGAPPIGMVGAEEHALIARFLARRREMAPQYRRMLAGQIAERVRARVSADLQRLDDEDLLEQIERT